MFRLTGFTSLAKQTTYCQEVDGHNLEGLFMDLTTFGVRFILYQKYYINHLRQHRADCQAIIFFLGVFLVIRNVGIP